MYEKFTDVFNGEKELFDALHEPKKKYRIYPICHDLCDAQSDSEKTADSVFDDEAGGFVTNTTWCDKQWVYNEANLRKLKDVTEYIRKKGMRVWMYDDYYYPSGLANGYAVKDHPEYFVKSIDFEKRNVKRGESISFESDGTVFAGIYSSELRLMHGIDASDTVADADGIFVRFFISLHMDDTAKELGASKGHLDHMSADAVKSYIEHALQPINEYMGMHAFDAIFTDEPVLTHDVISFARGKVDFTCIPVPYTDGLFEKYSELWHEDLREHLIELFAGRELRAKLTRVRYYETVSRMARENYINQVADWAKQHGTLSSGHFLLEEGLAFHVGYYGDYMRVVGGQDIPGGDLLCADGQRFWGKGNGFGTACSFAGKYPSSLAHLNGHNTVMLEICPVNWSDKVKKDPFKEFMALSTYIIFSGVTHYNAYGYFFTKEREKRQQLNRYVGRLLTVLRNARFASEIGVYYPITAMQSMFAADSFAHVSEVDFYPEVEELENGFERISEIIYTSGNDYTIIDSDHLAAAEVSSRLICGNVRISTLYVPFTEIIPGGDLCKMKEFANRGGKVVFIGKLPEYDTCGNNVSLDFEYSLIQLDSLGDSLVPEVGFIRDGIYVSPYEICGKRVIFCINKTESDITLTSSVPYRIYDPENDTLTDAETEFTVRAERGIMIFDN